MAQYIVSTPRGDHTVDRYPRLAAALFPLLFVPIFIAEFAFALWLIVKGVDVPSWKETV